ncbi:MAG: YkgJ family cysteine cluster protein [Dehalococcoidia bacterium]|nr:YkgJ family cysteine cluster protein [Dehalococcoidia bacterium]
MSGRAYTPEEWLNWNRKETWAFTVEGLSENRAIVLPVPVTPEMVAFFFKVFKCEHGGQCCTGPPGDAGVHVLDPEAKRLAGLLGVTYEVFTKKYAVPAPSGWQMQYPCPFYKQEEHRCGIYEHRPLMCQMYPLQEPPQTPEGGYALAVDGRCPGARLAAYRILRLMQEQRRRGVTFPEDTLKEAPPRGR